MKVKLHQIYKMRGRDVQVLICGKSGEKWKAKILTQKPGVYKGSHTLAERTLITRYEFVK